MNPIEKVVLPLKKDAMNRAEQFAKETIESVRERLAAVDNDLHIAAPYPSSSIARHQWEAAYRRYKLFSSLTEWRPNQIVRPNGTCYADVSEKLSAKFINDAREDAALKYDLYVAKLNKKIGPVQDARLEGNHVWSFSFLYVTTVANNKECWKTQTIINTSKLGKVFNQFPTRKVKQ